MSNAATGNNSSQVTQSPLTKELFMTYFNLFPKGNPESTWQLLKYQITQSKDFSSGKAIDHEMIFRKWSEYLEMCGKEARKEIYIKSFERFLVSKDYNINFSPKLGNVGFLSKYEEDSK